MIQVKIQQKIEEQLKRYNEGLIELEERVKLINTNVRPSIDDERGFIMDVPVIIVEIQRNLNEAKELHRTANELLQKSVESGDLHIKQGKIEVAVRRVWDKLDMVHRSMLNLIEYLLNIEKKQKERISRSEVGRRLLLKKATRGQQQPHLLKKKN